MGVFTASNGVWLNEDDGAYLGGLARVRPHQLRAARAELHRDQADRRLGRWRWWVDDHIVVYPEPDGSVTVFNERTAEHARFADREAAASDPRVEGVGGAAAAFYDEHPAPKPWMSAKPGEVWFVTYVDDLEARTGLRNQHGPHLVCEGADGKRRFTGPHETRHHLHLAVTNPLIANAVRI